MNSSSAKSTHIENITSEDALKILRTFLSNESNVKLVNFSLEEYSKEKSGALGTYQRLKITAQREDKGAPIELSFFTKSALNDDKNFEFFRSVFSVELYFYSKILPTLKSHCVKSESKWYPNCYLSKDMFLVLEDLKLQGYQIGGKNLELEKLKSALSSLARFHGSSILTEFQSKSKLNHTFPDAFDNKYFSKKFHKNYNWLKTGIEAAIAACNYLGLKNTSNNDKLRELMENAYKSLKMSKTHRNVICHGDLWAGNFMFDERNHCVLIDFQLLCYAPLALDLLQIIYINTDVQLRKSAETELLRFYWENLMDFVGQSNSSHALEGVPSFEDVVEAYEKFRIYGQTAGVIYKSIFYIDYGSLGDVFSDPIFLEKFTYVDRSDVIIECMKKDDVYKNRIKMELEDLLASVR